MCRYGSLVNINPSDCSGPELQWQQRREIDLEIRYRKPSTTTIPGQDSSKYYTTFSEVLIQNSKLSF